MYVCMYVFCIKKRCIKNTKIGIDDHKLFIDNNRVRKVKICTHDINLNVLFRQ